MKRVLPGEHELDVQLRQRAGVLEAGLIGQDEAPRMEQHLEPRRPAADIADDQRDPTVLHLETPETQPRGGDERQERGCCFEVRRGREGRGPEGLSEDLDAPPPIGDIPRTQGQLLRHGRWRDGLVDGIKLPVIAPRTQAVYEDRAPLFVKSLDRRASAEDQRPQKRRRGRGLNDATGVIKAGVSGGSDHGHEVEAFADRASPPLRASEVLRVPLGSRGVERKARPL